MTAEDLRRRRAEAVRQGLVDAWEQGRLAAMDGAEATDNPYAAAPADPRRCTVCGHGYVRCRAIDSKAIESERHDWHADRSRSDATAHVRVEP